MNRHIPFFIYLLIAFTLFFGSLNNDFLLDDFPQIVENPQVREPLQLIPTLQQSTLANGIYYKPMMTISYNTLWHAGSGSSYPFHILQTLLHAVNAFLVFFLFFRLTRKYSFSFFCGLIFLVHPINSETVLMIADLQEGLFTFFGLSALLIIPFISSYPSALAIILLFILSLLSKETGILYIFIAVTYAKIYQNELFRRTVLCAFIAGSSYLLLRLGVAQLSSLHSDNMQIMRADFLTRLITVPEVLAHYIHLFFYPKGISLTQDWIVQTTTWSNFWRPLFEVALLVTFISYLLMRARSKHLVFFAIWFFVGWIAHSQIIPIDGTVSDRWFYFPMIGFVGVILYAFSLKIPPKWFAVGLIFISLGLAIRTYVRTLDWESALTLYTSDLKTNPNSFYINNNLGLELLKLERAQEATAYFQKTIDVSPIKSQAWHTGWRNLGAAYLNLNQYGDAENCFRKAIEDGDVKSFRGMAVALYNQQKTEELAAFLTTVALPRYRDDVPLNNILKLITGK